MAIALGTEGFGGLNRTDTSNPMVWSHTPDNPPKGVLAGFVHGTSSTDHITAVTHGGVAMTRIVRATDTAGNPGAAELWFLGVGALAGTQNISATLSSGTTDDISSFSATFTATTDTEVIDFDSINNDAANPTVTLQKLGRTSICMALMYGFGAAPGGTLAADNTLGRTADMGAFYMQSCYETTVDAVDHTIGWSTLASADLAFVAVCISEVLPQILLPDADTATGGWTTAPLFSKVNDASDATIITATAA